MKGIRFYLEHKNAGAKRKGQHSGTVVALCIDERPYKSGGTWVQGAFVGVYTRPNSPVCYASAGLEYLQDQCKRISEAEAREIHPALFERLDEKEG